MSSPMSLPEPDPLHHALVALLADGRLHPFDEIRAALAEHLPADEDDAVEALGEALYDDRFDSHDDEHFFDALAVLDGRWFTHRMSAPEVDVGVIPLWPDITVPLTPFPSEEVRLTNGTTVPIVFDDWDAVHHHDDLEESLGGGGLIAPEGLLTGAKEGTVIAVRVVAGALECDPATPDPALTAAAAAALTRTFAEMTDPEEPVAFLCDLVIAWLLDDPDALRAPHEPLADLLEAAGLRSRGDWVGPSDSEWRLPHERARDHRRLMLEEVYGFEECCHAALAFVEVATGEQVDDAPARPLAKALSHGNVAQAFCADLGAPGSVETPADAFSAAMALAEHALSAARGPEAAGPHYLRAHVSEYLGRTLDAEAASRAALGADPGFRPAAMLLVEFLENRGEVTQALSVARRAGFDDDHPQVQRLAAIAAASAPAVGRNEPCPCGSGRKYKACCLGTPRVAPDQRFRWLYDKAMAFAAHPARRRHATHLAEHFIEGKESDEQPEVVAMNDGRLAELALFDDGLLERFLDARGHLLPAAEADLARSWLGRPLALFEVEDVQPGEGLSLRDTLTGERVQVRERLGSEAIEEGEFVLTRALPDGELFRLGGPTQKVDLRQRPSLLELTADDPDACDWAEWLGRCEAPPTLVNREGEPTILCEARYRVPHLSTAFEILATRLDPGGEDGSLVELVEVDGESIIRGFVTQEDGLLCVTANSEERFDRLCALVKEALPDAVVDSQSRRSPAEMSAGDRPRMQGDPEEVPPELRAALAEYMTNRARAWVDEAIPALGGMTPREALDDPTRRDDLMRLLREFDEHESPSTRAQGMPISVVREELGLPPI